MRLSIFADKNPEGLSIFIRHMAMYAYILLTCYGAANHAMWSDEGGTWAMARDTNWHDFLNFFSYTGHPPLWFSLVFPFARIGLPAETIQIINLCLSFLMAWLVLYRSPFTLWIKILFIFSMGMAFQYSIVARGYMLLTDLMFLIAWRYPKRMEQPLRYGLLLALLGNSEACASFPTTLLTLWFAWDCLKHPKGLKSFTLPLILPVLGGAIALAAMLPWDGVQNMQDQYKQSHYYSDGFSNLLGEGFMPYPLWFPVSNYFSLSRNYLHNQLFWASPGIIALACTFLYLLRTRWLIFYACWLSTIYFFFTYIHVAQQWHSYLLITGMIWSLWLYRTDPDTAKRSYPHLRYIAKPTALCLLITLAISDSASYLKYSDTYPFAGSKDMAHFIIDNGYEHEVIISLACFDTDAMAAYLPDTLFWFVAQNRISHYYLWGKYHNICTKSLNQTLPEMITEAQKHDFLVLTRGWNDIIFPPPLKATLLHKSGGIQEQFKLYYITTNP